MQEFIPINSVKKAHEIFQIDMPEHPLISVIDLNNPKLRNSFGDEKYIMNLYYIAIKDIRVNDLSYGRKSFDFQEGTMIFMRPGQVIGSGKQARDEAAKGWMLLFDPNLIVNYNLGEKMHTYNFFSYEINEALHLSTKERNTLTELVNKIKEEYSQNLDRHSQQLMVSNVELILDYCTRYYDRQFYTRSHENTTYASKFEKLLINYYIEEKYYNLGLPTVQFCGKALNLSPNYLSDLLRKETGKSAQDHIHDFIIQRAKILLLTPNSRVNEVALNLGFESPRYFSKLFRKKTNLSPSEFKNLN